MYYPESERIAADHQEAAEVIEELDYYLHVNEGSLIRAQRAADLLGVSVDRVRRFLQMYVDSGAVASHEIAICPECDVSIEPPEEDDGLFCDLCETDYEVRRVAQEEVFRPQGTGRADDEERQEQAPEAPEDPSYEDKVRHLADALAREPDSFSAYETARIHEAIDHVDGQGLRAPKHKIEQVWERRLAQLHENGRSQR